MFSLCNTALVISLLLTSANLLAQSKSTPLPMDTAIDFLAEPAPLVASSSTSPQPTPTLSQTMGSAGHPNAVVKDYLESLGVEFPEGSAAVYVASSGNLVVHNTTANLQKIDQLLQNGLKPLEEPEGVRTMRVRLAVTVIPRVNFGNASVAQAIHYLERESARVSRLSGTNDRVNIVLRTPPADGAEAANAKPAVKARINLHLANVTLDEALREVAAQAGLEFKVESNSVVLMPGEFSSPALVTKTFPFRFN